MQKIAKELEIKPFPENWLTIEQAIVECWFEYTYDEEDWIYYINCCWKSVNIDTYL